MVKDTQTAGVYRRWPEGTPDPATPGARKSSSWPSKRIPTPPDEIGIQLQRVEHESRVHIDIETDDIAAEVERLAKLGAIIDPRMERWVVMRAPTGQRFCVVRAQRDGFPKGATSWE